MSVNVIGDIAGRYDELIELLDKMPAAGLTLAVGDLIDRGPKSRQVIEWFMAEPAMRESVFGNHELMYVMACEYWPMSPLSHPYWGRNGGSQTMDSYGGAPPPAEHLRWLKNRPAWYKQDGLFVSHAPVYDVSEIPPQYGYNWLDWADNESTWPWNRYLSKRPMPGHFMVYGHNSHFVEHQYVTDEGTLEHYASCIDSSATKQLTGMHWPTRELFSVPYA